MQAEIRGKVNEGKEKAVKKKFTPFCERLNLEVQLKGWAMASTLALLPEKYLPTVSSATNSNALGVRHPLSGFVSDSRTTQINVTVLNGQPPWSALYTHLFLHKWWRASAVLSLDSLCGCPVCLSLATSRLLVYTVFQTTCDAVWCECWHFLVAFHRQSRFNMS